MIVLRRKLKILKEVEAKATCNRKEANHKNYYKSFGERDENLKMEKNNNIDVVLSLCHYLLRF